MKTPPALVLTASLLLFTLLVDISSAHDADDAKSPATVTRDDITFEIARYRRGRSGVSFEDDNHVSSEYIYNKAGYVATISAGSEEYKIVYDDHGVVEDVRRDDYGSRALTGEPDGDTEDVSTSDSATFLWRKEAVMCEDCAAAWDTVCGDGLVSLCELEESYGSVFGKEGAESVDTMCSTFLSACSHTSVGTVCEDRCDDGDGGSSSSSSSSDDSSSSSSSSSRDDGSSSSSSSSDDGSSDDDGDDDSDDDRDDDGTDSCDPNPCHNGGSCTVDPAGGHMCSCASGYGGMACETETSDLLGFYIEVAFLGDDADSVWTDGRRAVFTDAADRWEEVITNQRCSLDHDYFPGRLLINATLEYIDGPDNVLGEAGPRKILVDCPMTSLAGEMRFDTADVDLMETSGNFDTVVLHEMGHVIGMGTLWGNCSACDFENNIFDPEWKCPATVAAYNDLNGNPGGTDADIIELDGGDGTACGHFSELIFGDELSSGAIDTDIQDVYSPLSKITAASLDDTGYVVNATAVNPYILPSRREGADADPVEVTTGSESRYVMRSVAVKSSVELVDRNGNTVGEADGVMISLYGGYED